MRGIAQFKTERLHSLSFPRTAAAQRVTGDAFVFTLRPGFKSGVRTGKVERLAVWEAIFRACAEGEPMSDVYRRLS